MEIKFIDTTAKFVINGHEFELDVGEIEVAEKAEVLRKTCFEEFAVPAEGVAALRKAIDVLFGEGAADKVFEGRSSTNEVQTRRTALAISSGVTMKRTEMVLSAFREVKDATAVPDNSVIGGLI